MPIQFEDIYTNNNLKDLFKAYCKGAALSDHFDFIFKMQEMSSKYAVITPDKMKALYDTYIKDNAEKQVNLEGSARGQAILKKLAAQAQANNFSIDTFREAGREIESLLKDQNFNNFRQTAAFKKYEEESFQIDLIYTDPDAKAAFLAFAKSELTEEQVKGLLMINEGLKTVNDIRTQIVALKSANKNNALDRQIKEREIAIQKKLGEVYDACVKPDAPLQINVSDSNRALCGSVGKYNKEGFEQLKQEAEKLLKSNTVVRFVASKSFEDYIKQRKETAAKNAALNQKLSTVADILKPSITEQLPKQIQKKKQEIVEKSGQGGFLGRVRQVGKGTFAEAERTMPILKTLSSAVLSFEKKRKAGTVTMNDLVKLRQAYETASSAREKMGGNPGDFWKKDIVKTINNIKKVEKSIDLLVMPAPPVPPVVRPDVTPVTPAKTQPKPR